MAIRNLREINEIFQKVQNSAGRNQNALKSLERLYKLMNLDEFGERFLLCLKRCLVQESTFNPFINRTFAFCVEFCVMLQPDTEEEISCPFLSKVFECILQYHTSDKAKYRVCQFVNMLLKKLREDNCFLDENICDDIVEAMLVCIEDRNKLVRLQAIEALEGLQNVTDASDPVVKSFIAGLADNIPQVRKAIVRCICVNLTTIPIIIGRCLDIDDSVRLSAYERLSKISILHLTLVQRQKILRYGFKDESPKVQAFVNKDLLSKWFEKTNGDYLEFLRKLKLDADDNDFKQTIEIIEKVLDVMFSTNPLSELMAVLPLGPEKIVDTGEIQWELIVLWRCLIRFLRKADHTHDYVEQILPDLKIFCKFINRIYKTRKCCKSDWEIMQHGQIILELFKMSKEFDFSDEVGRQHIRKLVTTILTEEQLSFVIIRQLLQIYELLIPNVDERIIELCTIISDIREPLISTVVPETTRQKQESELMQYKLEILEAINEQETAVEGKDYSKAQEMQVKIDKFKQLMREKTNEFQLNQPKKKVTRNDPAILIKCLDILIALLTSEKFKSLPESLKLLQETFIQPLIMSDYPEIFQRAYNVLGLCCIIDKDLASKSANIFFSSLWYKKTCATYDDQNTLIAINTVTDMILIFGRGIFGEKDPNVTNNTTKRNRLMPKSGEVELSNIPTNFTYEDIIEILSEMFDYDSPEIRECAGKAIIKLMCSGVIQSPILFSKLLLNWFNPATGKESRLGQLMGLMFLEYANCVPGSLEVIEQAFIPTISVLVDAPLGSPLCDVDIDSAVRFMLELCRTAQQKSNTGLETHKNLAFIFCNEICNQPKKQYTYAYVKALIHLEPPYEDEVAISELIKLADIMIDKLKEIQDKRALRYAIKFKSKLEGKSDQTEVSGSCNTTAADTTTTTNANGTNGNCTNANSTKDNEEASASTKFSTLNVQKRKKHTSVASATALSTVDEDETGLDPVTPPSTPESQGSPRRTRKRRCKKKTNN